MKCGAAPSGTLAAPDSFKAGGDIDAVSKESFLSMMPPDH
jgi:hypothetical protein